MATKTKEVATKENENPIAATPETKYSKPELLSLTAGSQRVYFDLALKANLKYTWNEANKTVEDYKTGGLF